MDLSVTVPKGDGSVVFKNPIMTACGCFGNIVEYMDAFDITRLGAASMSRPDFFPRLIDDLYATLDRLGVSSLDEIRGCARVDPGE